MREKVTKFSPSYSKGEKPDYMLPKDYCSNRFALGKKGSDPLVIICMNPSVANEETSDLTINRLINAQHKLEKTGWMVFNTYPERATKAVDIVEFDDELSKQNIEVIKEFLLTNYISEVWGAWGNDNGIEALVKGKHQLLTMLKEIQVKVFYFGNLTKMGNPKHPLQRLEKWNISEGCKNYLQF